MSFKAWYVGEGEVHTVNNFLMPWYDVHTKAITPTSPLTLMMATRVYCHHSWSTTPDLKAVTPKTLAMVSECP
jgi:hypothetical protein